MRYIILFIVGVTFGSAMSDEDSDSKSDLSAENNFFRFKKAINHALPGQSFFRINFNSPHPDHGKGKILRQLGHEVVKSNKWNPIPKTHSKPSPSPYPVKSRVVSSTTIPYKPINIEVSPKSEPIKENQYQPSSSNKGLFESFLSYARRKYNFNLLNF